MFVSELPALPTGIGGTGEWGHAVDAPDRSPATPAEHQIVQLIADLTWRLKRVERIEQRRALAILRDLVDQTPEWAARARAHDLVLGLDTVARMVASSPLPVPTSRAGAFLAGLRGVENLVEQFRTALAPELSPAGVCAFLGAVKNLALKIDTVRLRDVHGHGHDRRRARHVRPRPTARARRRRARRRAPRTRPRLLPLLPASPLPRRARVRSSDRA